MPAASSVIGRPLVKVDAAAKVAGETRFADDIALPRMAFARFRRSTEAHARVLAVRTEEAERMPGVLGVLTGRDLPARFGILPVSQDEHALAVDRVRFVGEPVAAVAAVDEETADRAARAIRVDYDPLPAYLDIEEALACRGEPIHDDARYEGNVQKQVALEFGDVEGGFARADRIFEDAYFYEGSTHLPLEQHAAVASAEPDGRLTLWSSTQTPHYVHRAAASVLGMPASRIRVIACPNGGGFGGKSDPFGHELVVAALSLRLGRPVKATLNREEVFHCHRGRHPVRMWVRTGIANGGEILAMHFRSFLDGGAYGSYGVASLYYTGALQTVTQRIAAYRFEGLRVFTNKPPCGPKRGHGTPQPRFALECHYDRIARELDVPPHRFRRRSVVAPGSVTINQLQLGTVGLGECLDAVVKRSDFERKRGRLPDGRGVGLAVSSYITGAGLPIYYNDLPHSGVVVQLDRSGGVTAFCGSTDIGQGSDTVLASVVAEEFGLPLADVRVVTGDTSLTPVDLGSYSSRVTLMTGNAAIQAARRLRPLLVRAASAALAVPAGRIAFRDGLVLDDADPSRSIPFREAAALAEAREGTLSAAGSYSPPRGPGRYKGAGVGPSPAYSYAAAAVELEVDRETGRVRVERVFLAHDLGRAINPTLARGQVEGSVYMGLGEALMEAHDFRTRARGAFPRGVHLGPSMLDYKSPTFLDMPEVETVLVETNEPEGPYGAKECGQGPLLPIPPAVANAVYDAVGVRMREVPIRPDRLLLALDGRLPAPAIPRHRFPEPIRPEPLPEKFSSGSRPGDGSVGRGRAPVREGASR